MDILGYLVNGSYSIVHLNSTSLFYQNLPVEYQVSSQHHVEKSLQICLKIKHYLFRLFLHIGQWMHTMNMPLFVTNYLRERDS